MNISCCGGGRGGALAGYGKKWIKVVGLSSQTRDIKDIEELTETTCILIFLHSYFETLTETHVASEVLESYRHCAT